LGNVRVLKARSTLPDPVGRNRDDLENF
jgi:hypothetical protein